MVRESLLQTRAAILAPKKPIPRFRKIASGRFVDPRFHKTKGLNTTCGLSVLRVATAVKSMDVKTYLQTRKEALGKQTSAIKDFTVFDFNYIPDQPLMREEARVIIDAILQYSHTRIPKNLALFGSRGSGKTLMVRYIAQELQTDQAVTLVYCNVRNHNTSFKALASILRVPIRGASLDELFTKFKNMYPGKTVVVLDEIDTMSPKDRTMEILYMLSRASNNYMIIMLANSPRVLQTMDASTKSTLQPETIHFKNYDAQEIRKILEARALKGLTHHSEEHLQRIAALVTKHTNSDVRVAIKSLYYLASEPELDVERAFGRANKDVVVDVIHDLNDRCLLILESARRSQTAFVREFYQRHKGLSEAAGEIPFSYTHFYNHLSYLQSCGLILLIATKVGRAYTNRIRLLFDPDIEAATFKARFR